MRRASAAVLGVSVALSEQEAHWRQFLQGLVSRGLRGVRLVISDAHAGLRAARQAVFGGVPWQRCQFHLQQNASAYVPKQDMKAQAAADIRAVFGAQDRAEADALLRRAVQRYEATAPKLAAWLEESLPEGPAVFAFPEAHRRLPRGPPPPSPRPTAAFPEAHRRLLRTTNGVERVNREVKRRTQVVSIFPNEASCLRLASAVLMEISDDWQSGKAYLTLTE